MVHHIKENIRNMFCMLSVHVDVCASIVGLTDMPRLTNILWDPKFSGCHTRSTRQFILDSWDDISEQEKGRYIIMFPLDKKLAEHKTTAQIIINLVFPCRHITSTRYNLTCLLMQTRYTLLTWFNMYMHTKYRTDKWHTYDISRSKDNTCNTKLFKTSCLNGWPIFYIIKKLKLK